MYCATCILHWALHKEEPWCPQCKQPFDTLLTYRTLDGELQVRGHGWLRCMLRLLLLLPAWFAGH